MNRSVTVSGQGAATVVPDQAVVRVSAVHRAAGVAEATHGVASTVAAVGEVSRRFTEGSRIGTTDFSIWPAHDREGNPDGFEARHSIAVVVTDVVEAGALVSALAAEVGARMTVEGVSLEVSDPGEALARARELAVADARSRATHLAVLSGARLGEVLSVVEGGPDRAPRPAVSLASRGVEDVAFEPGERSVSVSVTVTWSLG